MPGRGGGPAITAVPPAPAARRECVTAAESGRAAAGARQATAPEPEAKEANLTPLNFRDIGLVPAGIQDLRRHSRPQAERASAALFRGLPAAKTRLARQRNSAIFNSRGNFPASISASETIAGFQ